MKQSRNRNAQYGDPHWDATTYPNHKIVHIRQFGDGTGEFHAFYYAADRPDQDKYNWEYKSADIGGTKFDTVERTYVIKRADFEQEKAEWVVGTAMSRLPTTNQQGDEYAFPVGYILAETECGRIDEVMDGLFVAVKNTYIKRVVTSSNNFDEQFGGNLNTSEILYHSGETVSTKTSQQVGITLAGVNEAGSYDSAVLDFSTVPVGGYDEFYVAVNDAQTVYFGPSHTTMELAMQYLIEEFNAGNVAYVSEIEGEPDKLLFENSSIGNSNTTFSCSPEIGSFVDFVAGVDPVTAVATVGVTHTNQPEVTVTATATPGMTAEELALLIRSEITATTTLDVSGDGGDIILERRGSAAYVTDGSFAMTLSFDVATDITQEPNDRSAEVQNVTIDEVFTQGDNEYWGLQNTGIARSGRQLSDKWFLVTESNVVPEFMTTTGRTFHDTIDFRWPNVLDHVQIDIWNRKDGGADYIVYPIWARNAYGGPCKATIVETFHSSPVATSAIRAMLDIEIDIITPLIQVRIPQSLHFGANVQVFVGSEDPLYQSTGFNYTYPSTNYTDWPPTLLVQSDIQPMRGGYLKRNVTIERPQ